MAQNKKVKKKEKEGSETHISFSTEISSFFFSSLRLIPQILFMHTDITI